MSEAPGDVGHGLGARALATTRAIAEALFATEAGPPPDERVQWLSSELDDFFARAGAKSRFVFGLSLFAVSVIAPLLVRRVAPLRALAPADRTRALEAMERSKLAMPLLAIKAMLCVMYYEHPDASRAIGFEAGCMNATHAGAGAGAGARASAGASPGARAGAGAGAGARA